VPITKVQEQMNLAWQYGANRIWIDNVGDLKPMEFPIEFFLSMAWNPARWSYDRLEEYSRTWAAREFGAAHAQEVAALIAGYTKLNSLRKPEMLAPDTFSLVNYGEAERILAQWRDLSVRAVSLRERLPVEARDAFFQLVEYPVRASAAVQEMYVAAGRNQLYALQGRSDANQAAEQARRWFGVDGTLAFEYHALRGGKWNHMMDQINIGYTYWQQPDIEVMPAVSDVRARTGGSLAMAIEGNTTAWPSYGARPAMLPPLDQRGAPGRWIELFNRGDSAYRYQATADQPWVHVEPASGSVSDTVRLTIGIDWDAVPPDASMANVRIEADTGEQVSAAIPVRRGPEVPKRFRGFIETDGHVAIEAPHYTRSVAASDASWKVLPDFGRTQGAVTIFPVTAAERTPQGKSPRLEYDVYLTSTGAVQVQLDCAPSLDFQSGEGLRIAVSLDDAPAQTLKLDTWAKGNWDRAVAQAIRRVVSAHTVTTPGAHTLKVWMVTPGVVLERIVIDAGGVRPSYLGPPESVRVSR
jgi:hypothetical protein